MQKRGPLGGKLLAFILNKIDAIGSYWFFTSSLFTHSRWWLMCSKVKGKVEEKEKSADRKIMQNVSEGAKFFFGASKGKRFLGLMNCWEEN